MNRAGFAVFASMSIASTLFAPGAFAQSPPAAPTTIAVGDWQLTPLVELRTRGEYWHAPVDVGGGVDTTGVVSAPSIDDAGGVLERARLGVGAERGPLKAQLTLQDARAWGSTPSAALLNAGATAPAALRLFEGYAEAHTSAARPTYLRVGRQVVSWGEGRLLGAAEWSPIGRSLDAARAHLGVGSAWDFELLAAILDSPRPLGNDVGDVVGVQMGGQELYGASATWALAPIFRVQLYGLARVSRVPGGASADARAFGLARSNGETYTGALHLFGEQDGWKWGAEGAYQAGTASSLSAGGTTTRAAYAAAASVTKSLERVLFVPTFRLGGSYASGDDGSGAYKQFDPILPDMHTFYGAMDIFSWSNIVEGNLRATIAPTSDTTASVEYRYAQMAQKNGEWLNGYLTPVGRAPSSSSAELGHEVDAWMTYSPWSPLDLVVGYSLFAAGEGAKAVLAAEGRGAPSGQTFAPASLSHFAYLQATVRAP